MLLHKSWIAIIPTLFLFCYHSMAQDAQEEAIKKTIADENASFVKRDAEAWKSTWLQDDKVSRTVTNFFGSTVHHGWKDVSEDPLRFLSQNPGPDSVTVSTDSFSIRREGNMAVVDYKQLLKFPSLPPFDKSATREQRVLIKKNGKWLIAAATSTDINSIGVDAAELNINKVGYDYLFAGRTDEAIKVLELNTVLFPNSFNVWDSLGEAYAKAGNKEKAREYYEKSLVLNPNNDNGKKALTDLK